MTPEQALWEDELARAVNDLAQAEKYDDVGAIEWNKERISWAKKKIEMYESIDPSRKKLA